jgi:hypothetical protein
MSSNPSRLETLHQLYILTQFVCENLSGVPTSLLPQISFCTEVLFAQRFFCTEVAFFK